MSKTGSIAKVFLESLTCKQSSEIWESLQFLVTELEKVNDPDPVELRLIDNIYTFMSGLRVLENNIKSYVTNTTKSIPPGEKLSSLYD